MQVRLRSIIDSFKSFAFLKILKTGHSFAAVFYIVVTIPVSYGLRYIIVEIGSTCDAISFNILGVKLSGPAALYGFSVNNGVFILFHFLLCIL